MRLRFEGCLLDSGTREVFRGDRQVHLSPKAFDFLWLLMSHRPNAVSKEEIHRGLWPDSFVADSNLPTLVNELRVALGDDAQQPRIIRTVQRYGYAFLPQAETLRGPEPGGGAVAHRLVWGDREINLGEGENLIGRDQAAVVWVDDGSVSRHHARILIDRSGARLEDLGSKNGTYVRTQRVEALVTLNDGDALRFGSVAMVFRRFDAGASTDTLSRH